MKRYTITLNEEEINKLKSALCNTIEEFREEIEKSDNEDFIKHRCESIYILRNIFWKITTEEQK